MAEKIQSRELSNLIPYTEAAANLNIKPDTLYRKCRSGDVLGAKQIGRQWLVPQSLAHVQIKPGGRGNKKVSVNVE